MKFIECVVFYGNLLIEEFDWVVMIFIDFYLNFCFYEIMRIVNVCILIGDLVWDFYINFERYELVDIGSFYVLFFVGGMML